MSVRGGDKILVLHDDRLIPAHVHGVDDTKRTFTARRKDWATSIGNGPGVWSNREPRVFSFDEEGGSWIRGWLPSTEDRKLLLVARALRRR